ncbi:hypothetical protein Sjap_010947 [Stephania japonica]|uniref:Uncharacterized protein n=1 Tax=Stephania japonica TaxID=461633 RepID=A0AAP0JBF3_9MAGN
MEGDRWRDGRNEWRHSRWIWRFGVDGCGLMKAVGGSDCFTVNLISVFFLVIDHPSGSMPKKGKEAPKAAFQDIDESERQLLKPLDGFAPPDPISIGYPILFSVTGFKHSGAEKLKTIDVLAHFIPENLRSKDIITTSIDKCQMSIDGYRNIGNFDLTKDKQEEELPHVKLVHPCTCCNLEHENAGRYGAVKVGIEAVYRQLLGKQQFVDYQINCGSTGTPIGVVIFSKLKKSHTGLKRILAGVHETAKEVGPYVGPVLGAVGFFVN